MHPHFVGNIYWTCRKPLMKKGIQLNINPWAREKEMATNQPHYPPAKRRSPNYAASTSQANRQHLFNGEQDVQTYLQTPISTIPPRSLSSVLPRTIVWWPWVYGRYQMRTKDPRRNVRISTRYQQMDKEDIARCPNDVLINVRNWNCNNDHNGWLSKLLATGGWKNFVIFQQHHIFSLQSGSLSLYALGNACGVSHSLRKERYTSEAVGSWTNGSSQKDHWK